MYRQTGNYYHRHHRQYHQANSVNNDEDDLLWDDGDDDDDDIEISRKQNISHQHGDNSSDEEVDEKENENSFSSSSMTLLNNGGGDDDHGEGDGGGEDEDEVEIGGGNHYATRKNDRQDFELRQDYYVEESDDNDDSDNNSNHSSSTNSSSSSSSSSSTSSIVSVQSVVERIEEFILQAVIEPLTEDPNHPSLPEINAFNPKTNFKRKLSFHHLTHARSLTSIVMVASFCHDLLSQSTNNTTDESYSDDDDDSDIGNETSCDRYHHLNNDENRNNGNSKNCLLRSDNADHNHGNRGVDNNITNNRRHRLLRRTTTTREVYYFYVTHFRDQRECDKAIWDLVSILNLPSRQSLGLVASPKGWFCGSIDVYNGRTNELKFNGRELDTHGIPITPSTYDNDYITYYTEGRQRHDDNNRDRRCCVSNNNRSSNSSSIPSSSNIDDMGIIGRESDGIEYEYSETRMGDTTIRIESDARCILVIEKEGVYTRLSEDKFFLRFLPCILVTGKGFPDVATRRWVRTMQKTLNIPVYGLCDCNPYGVSVLDSYRYDKGVKVGNVEEGRTKKKKRQGIDDKDYYHPLKVQWIGLFPSQVEMMDLPPSVFQRLTNNDKKRLDSLLTSASASESKSGKIYSVKRSLSKSRSKKKNKLMKETPCAEQMNHNRRVAELKRMHKYKVELEALHWKGMDYLCRFVYETILEHEKSQHRSDYNTK